MGHRSSLKASQSISDLSSHFTEKHHRPNRISTGNRSGQHLSKLTNPSKPVPNPKPKYKSLQLTNKNPGVDNPVTNLEVPKENFFPKSQTTSCLSEKLKSAPKRPITLTLKKTEKYKLSLNKTNLSLPESPVCEELKVLKEHCKKNMSRFARFAQKRRSCSYFIGLDDNQEEMETIAKSFESLPAMNEYNLENLDQNSDDGDDGNGNFSDDSLEGDFKNPPRRCISDYQINLESQSENYTHYQNFYKRVLTQSQESILSDASVESFSKGSADILDCNNYDNDRHSSASFFLSRRKMKSGRSQESILTDESDYQMFPLQKNADHRSTESVLTDDSDSMVKSAPLEMLFDSHYKRKRQNSETYTGNANETANTQYLTETSNSGRAVFRSKSLQDTSLNLINKLNKEISPQKSCVYYELDVNAENVNSDNIRGSNVSRRNSLKVTKGPQSMLILNDYVAHKPPKPKRNSSRTQSMRNRARPAWNQYGQIETQRFQRANLAENNSMRRFEHFLQSRNMQSDESKNLFSLQIRNDQNQKTLNQNLQNQNLQLEKENKNVEYCIERQIPTKDTEAYDSLEPGGAPDSSTESSESFTNPKFESINASMDTSVDIRITRAIEGTVKLLSKEFENLVRREQQNLMKGRSSLKQEANENFAKLEAERDIRCSKLNKELRIHSGGEDSDCADLSTIDRSLLESGSSTPLSSCTNSPKRMWPPASRCHSYMKWSKTLPTISQSILPSKHPFSGTGIFGEAASVCICLLYFNFVVFTD